MVMGYVIVNDRHTTGPVVCDEESKVYSDRPVAEKTAKRLRREHDNPGINVYELVSPGTLYRLCEDDIFEIAKESGVSRKRIKEKMHEIQKGIEDGFYHWSDVVEAAIESAKKRN